MSRTRAVAEWVNRVKYGELPDETTSYAKALLLKTVAGMVAGSREPISKILNTYYAQQGGVSDAGVVNGGFRTTVENAAFMNATFAHASELEDNELPSITSAFWMFPALFPMAEKQVSTGKEVIEAAVIAWEVASRYCRAAPGYLLMMFHMCPPSWFGPLGVAAAGSKLLKSTVDQTEHAITISASYASGLGQAGCDVHFLESGHTAKMGLQSAILAHMGATGELGLLELSFGGLWSPVAAQNQVNLEIIDAGLGEPPYLINQACIKKYSACTYAHTSIDALGLIMKEHHLTYDDVEHVETVTGPLAHMAVGSHPQPADLQEARFSLEYLLAEVLLNGRIDVTTFAATGKLKDPKHKEAAAKVSSRANGEHPFQYPGAEVTVTKRDGQKLTRSLDGWIGSPEHPLNVKEIRDICRPYLETMLDKRSCDRVEELVLGLDEQPDVHELMDILTFARVGHRRG